MSAAEFTHLELDDLQTPIALYDPQGRLAYCNLAMDGWCEGQVDSLGAVLQSDDWQPILARLEKGQQIVRRSAKTPSGRSFPAEMLVRSFRGPDGFVGVMVEGRDASRTEQQEMMLKSFSKVIDESNKKLRMQTAELSALLNGMRQAVFAVDAELKVVAPVSSHAHIVFGQDIAQASILDTLYGELDRNGDLHSRLMTVLATVYGADELQWEMICDQLPERIEYRPPLAQGLRTLDITYSPIWNADAVLDRIIFTVIDVTEKLALQAAIEEERAGSRQTLQRLEQLAANDVAALEMFFSATANALRRTEELLRCAPVSLENLHEIFRHAHTIKGNARVLGLSGIVESAHRLESKIGQLRDRFPTQAPIQAEWIIVQSQLKQLRSELRGYSRPAQQVFRIEDVFTRDMVRELDGLCENLSIQLVLHDNGNAAAISEIRRALHTAKGLARLLNDEALAGAVHEAESCIESAVVKVGEGNEASALGTVPAVQNFFIRMLPHGESIAPEINETASAEMIGDLNQWTEALLSGQSLNLVSLAHRYAARARALDARWLEIGYRQLESLLDDNRTTGPQSLIRQVLAFLYARIGLEIELHASRMSTVERRNMLSLFDAKTEPRGVERRGDLRALLALNAQQQSTTLNLMARLWGADVRAIAGELFASPFEASWNIAAIQLAMHDTACDAAYATLDEAGIDDAGAGRLLRRYLHYGFALPSYSARRELLSLFRQNTAKLGENPRPARRMRKVSEQALSELESLLEQPNLSFEMLLNASKRVLAVPADVVTAPFAAMIADLAQTLGKRAQWVIRRQHALFTPAQASKVGEALMHMLRNALDHGLEMPAEREQHGKDPVGKITLEIEHQAHAIRIILTDDGRGIDPHAVMSAACEMQSKDRLETLSRQEVLRLILLPGLSTARSVSQVSGRGVGMDVVADNIKKLEGEIEIDSEPGRGCRFVLTLPALVSI